ncbi:hypothetical protein SY91_00908 [Burkholderia cenocepacia]|uniref:hypothetical protein n=1 Tax=Burkholderia cenocepacia TaxID=95486 RepID=UPI0003C4B4A8|nr:hypothetical protein [Burkholderia cenocepacia]ESS39336.1 hypothetical protein P355_3979 [Burkholderia cenocepacia KC-01]QND93537.1 hypothetical protein SY91_00908 [Burkholderia cenocepacia]
MTNEAVARGAGKSLSPVIAQTVWAGILLNALAIALAFTAYKFDYGVSSLPGQISVAIAVACVATPVICWLVCRRTNKFIVYGWLRLVSLLSAYALIGIAFYFYYFIFAPMPVFARVAGLAIGGGLSVYWTVYSYLALTRHIAHSDFEGRAFDIDDGAIVCRKDFFETLDAAYAERSPFVKWHSWIVMALAPFFLVLSRLLSMYFGTGGVLFFVAAITFPASLWLIGVMIRVGVTMIQLPHAMERKYRKPVLMARDASF